jgi:hypothetical protein
MFLSANNFFWRVVRSGDPLTKTNLGGISVGPRRP